MTGVPLDSYITRFDWDAAKYSTMTPLREVVDTIQEGVSKLEDDLKVPNFGVLLSMSSGVLGWNRQVVATAAW